MARRTVRDRTDSHKPKLAAHAAEWLLNSKGLPETVLAERAWLARDAGNPGRLRAARSTNQAFISGERSR